MIATRNNFNLVLDIFFIGNLDFLNIITEFEEQSSISILRGEAEEAWNRVPET